MSLFNEPRAWEDQNGGAPVGSEQRLRVSLKSGAGPLSGIPWTHHTKITMGSTETFRFYKGDPNSGGVLLATGILTYENSSLKNLIGSAWSYP